MTVPAWLTIVAGAIALGGASAVAPLPEGGWVHAAVLYTTVVLVMLIAGVERFRAADLVTFVRLLLGCLIAGGASAGVPSGTLGWWLAGIAGVAIALDAVDGWVARRTGPTAAGARFDMEVDALVALFICLVLAPKVGWWVMAIGLARYAFGLAAWLVPALASPLPPSERRRAACAVQQVALVLALVPAVPTTAAAACAALALAVTGASFAIDVAWSLRRR